MDHIAPPHGYDEAPASARRWSKPWHRRWLEPRPWWCDSATHAQTVNPGQNATFTVTASGSPGQLPMAADAGRRHHVEQPQDNGVYSGSATATLTVTRTLRR